MTVLFWLLVSILIPLILAEVGEVGPWTARQLAIWAAMTRYGDTERGRRRAEEWLALLDGLPGKLIKLGVGLHFAVAAGAVWLKRLVLRQPAPFDSPGLDDVLDAVGSRRILPVEDEPSELVARYLFPTERYRGEWRRHWIHLAKQGAIILLYAVLGTWAVVLRFKPQYVVVTVIGIWVVAVLLAVHRVVLWYFTRFTLSNKRLMSTEGIISRTVAMQPLLNVVDLRYEQSLLGRILNYGTFRLESAKAGSRLRKYADLPHPNELYLRIVEEIYEPAAVEARLGSRYDLEYAEGDMPFDPDLPYDPPAPPATDRITDLALRVAELTQLVQQLVPPPAAASSPVADQPLPDLPHPRPEMPTALAYRETANGGTP
jgi:hypothetical protein